SCTRRVDGSAAYAPNGRCVHSTSSPIKAFGLTPCPRRAPPRSMIGGPRLRLSAKELRQLSHRILTSVRRALTIRRIRLHPQSLIPRSRRPSFAAFARLLELRSESAARQMLVRPMSSFEHTCAAQKHHEEDRHDLEHSYRIACDPE